VVLIIAGFSIILVVLSNYIDIGINQTSFKTTISQNNTTDVISILTTLIAISALATPIVAYMGKEKS
jgi:hypothetical protein